MAVQRINTLLIQLEEEVKNATPLEVHSFIRLLGLAAEDVVAIQFGLNRKDIFAKLTNESLVEKIIEKHPKRLPFPSEDTKRGYITLERTSGSPVNVKISCLPPEVSKEDIRDHLSRYGKVIRMSDDKWSGNQLFGVLTGTRIARMVVEKNIPSYVNIAGNRAIIIYDGQRRTCARCGEEGHERRLCPRNYASRSYAQATSGETVELSEAVDEECGLTPLGLEGTTQSATAPEQRISQGGIYPGASPTIPRPPPPPLSPPLPPLLNTLGHQEKARRHSSGEEETPKKKGKTERTAVDTFIAGSTEDMENPIVKVAEEIEHQRRREEVTPKQGKREETRAILTGEDESAIGEGDVSAAMDTECLPPEALAHITSLTPKPPTCDVKETSLLTAGSVSESKVSPETLSLPSPRLMEVIPSTFTLSLPQSESDEDGESSDNHSSHLDAKDDDWQPVMAVRGSQRRGSRPGKQRGGHRKKSHGGASKRKDSS